MMDITLVANGYDFSSKLSKYYAYYEVQSDVLTMLDKSERLVCGSKRPIVEFTLLPLTDEESAEIYAKLEELVFSATFDIQGAEITADMRVVSNLGAAFLLKSVDGKRRYKGDRIVLRGLRVADS